MTTELAERSAQPEARQTPYHHGDLRNALLKAGLDILSTEGTSAFTLREVARRAGVSHNAPYNHFASKEALLAAIAEDGFTRLADRIRAVIEDHPGKPRRHLLEAGWAYVSFVLENPGQVRVMYGGTAVDSAQYPALQLASAHLRDMFVDIIRRGQVRHFFKQGDPATLALAALSMMHGFAMLILAGQVPTSGPSALDPEQTARLFSRLLYDGLGAK